VRRSRGYAPLPITLNFDTPDLLAVGGELKATICVASGRLAWMSQHIGDIENLETLAHPRKTHPDLTVFATSGYSDSLVMSRPRDFGFTDSIQKPFLHEEFAAMLNRHLGRAV